MSIDVRQFAATDASGGGISALGINLKGFLFQLITFLIVLLLLRRYVFPRLVATLEARRETLEKSLIQAKQTEEALAAAEQKAAKLLHDARTQADGALSDAQKKAADIINQAEGAGAQRASRIIKEAQEHLDQERKRLHDELRAELADLVVLTTEKVLKQKLDPQTDARLIEKSIKETVL